MKKLFLLLSILCVSLMSCTKTELPAPETTFTLQLTQQPIGGTEIQTASISFVGTIHGLVKPVNVTVEWKKETEAKAAEQSIFTEVHTFTQGNAVAKSSVCRIVSPFPQLSFYYWAVISWTDDMGQLHTIQTNKVLCTTEKEF